MSIDGAILDICLLDEFRVVRADGSVVETGAWGTGKTMDLLRILALTNGRLVRSCSLIEILWPDVVPSRGRGSLRTAASRIRIAVGHDCIERQNGDLKLVTAVVDVDRYRALVSEVRQASSRRAHAETLLLAGAAEAVYLEDLHASDDEQPWVVHARSELVQMRLGVLADAARAALELGRFREALELARTAVHLDPSSESALRHLMRAHAELGEIGQALRLFEICRTRLAEELGIDPSRATRELHLELLQDRGQAGS
jgi:DNA-binding SARP family transcriptional activator